MDPDAALKELLLAVEAGDVDRVEELAEGLLNWLQRGGFPLLTIVHANWVSNGTERSQHSSAVSRNPKSMGLKRDTGLRPSLHRHGAGIFDDHAAHAPVRGMSA